jgi:hypothetical protein
VSEVSDGRRGTGRSSNPELIAEDDSVPACVKALMRHFVDLRDNTHGGSTRRHAKEDHFVRAVELLHPVAGQVLREINTMLLLESGRITDTRIAKDAGRRLGGFMGSHVVRTALGRRGTYRADGLLRDRLPPPASEGRDGRRLAAEHLHQSRCRRPASPSARHR